MAADIPVRDRIDAQAPARRPRRRRGRRILAGLLGGSLAVGGLLWVGLRVEPPPLPPAELTGGTSTTVPLPDDLPPPVDRFYRQLYGDRVPVVTSAVISGRGHMRIAGVRFPARFRFSHVSGHDYRHHIQLTVFGRTLVAVDEHFVDGHGRLDLPFGVSEGPRIDQGANLALWAEAVWMPSVWVTDPRVTWGAVDGTTATLSVPFGDEVETFTVAFDPSTGELRRMESMRFKGADDEDRTRWINEVDDWTVVDGRPVPGRASITWADEGTPWAELTTEEVVHDADLERYIVQDGP